eukprot:jgi/Phyca11/21840/fgenesh1_pg.PHYCAscaffold_148_\
MREIYDLSSLHDYSWPVVMAACTTEATAMTWCRKETATSAHQLGRHSTKTVTDCHIMSHMWPLYVNPQTGAHTQRIEGDWEVRLKYRLKQFRGYPKELIPGRLY